MNPLLLSITGLIYVGVAIQYFLAERPWMGFVFVCYAFSNLGFYMEAK